MVHDDVHIMAAR